MEGINCSETFSVAVKVPSVHIILANAAQKDWEIHQIDVKSAYLWMIMHLDRAFAVGLLSQFIQNPRAIYWEALKYIMIYLGLMKELWLTFGGQSKNLVEGFCNADYVNW